MKKTIYLLGVILFIASMLTSCKCKKPVQFSSNIEASITIEAPYSVAEAKQDFSNFRKSMGYVDAATGRSSDTQNGYFDISTGTLQNLMRKASEKGWANIRVYHGIDKNGGRILIANGLSAGSGESSKLDSDQVIKVENPSLGPGADCPRWCDVSGTTLGK